MKEVLTIAGSDSGGGAGIQADLKTFAALGVHGLSVITALTAQNSRGVSGIQEVGGDFVAAQLQAVLQDFQVEAVKTGMLANGEVIQVVSRALKEHGLEKVVVDPVMVAQSGDSLLQQEAIRVLKEELLPQALVVTPNLPEAGVLAGMTLESGEEIQEAARRIRETGVKNVVIKGGHHKSEAEAVDILYDGKNFYRYRAARLDTPHTHGTGCSFASALAAYLALGASLREGVEKSKKFITLAIKHAYPAGQGYGPVNPLARLYQEKEKNRVLENLQKALGILKGARVAPLVPEVQSNLVMALPRAQDPGEVAGFPGRIIKVGEEIRTLAPPRFNCSRWMSGVVLAVTRHQFPFRAAMNIKATPGVLEACQKAGLTMASFDREQEPAQSRQVSLGRSLDWGTDQVIREKGSVPDLIYDRGCLGMEAICRVIGKDAVDVARKVATIGENYLEVIEYQTGVRK